MKKCFAILFLVAMSLTTGFANYLVVTADQVNVTSDGMLFVNVDGAPVPVDSINTANNGFLVAIPSPNAAICPSCGRDGYTPGGFCKYCGFPDDAKRLAMNAVR